MDRPEEQRHTKPDGRLSGKLDKVDVEGFKSLKNISLQLKDINILIGANGSGKSNLLDFFEMLSFMMSGSLRRYVSHKGGGNELLFHGAKRTPSIGSTLSFGSATGRNDYQFRLSHTEADTLAFGEERYKFTRNEQPLSDWRNLGIGHMEAKIVNPELGTPAHITSGMMKRCEVYQFHDTSSTSRFKNSWDADDARYLRAHGGNLPAILLMLRNDYYHNYQEIVHLMNRMLPIFKDFELDEDNGRTKLRWVSQADADKSFGAWQTSDGSLRLMALTTLLCMPSDLQPDIILLDEPELGLHPDAIAFVAEMIKGVGINKQLVVATQSPLLLNEFVPADIIVVEMNERGETELQRLDEEEFRHWLVEFNPGDLWLKNLLGGNP